jgi:hypothetical protein
VKDEIEEQLGRDKLKNDPKSDFIAKKRENSINSIKFPGGVRAQAQCFLWGLFFHKSL